MKKKPFIYKNLLLFDGLADDDDFFDSEEDDKHFTQYKKTLKHLQKMLNVNGGETRLFKIPPPKPTDARWVLPGEKVVFGNYKITAGFFYFGTNLPSGLDDSRNFASLINPNISIPKKKKLDSNQNLIPHVIDYAELSGIQRRKYVLWHIGGRADENIHDWFAMLFLYGLERRVLIDRTRGIVKQDELMQIRDEVQRILELYGGKSIRIRSAYSNFLAYLELECASRKLYDITFPYFECKKYKESDIFPVYIDIALSQCAEDGVPVNANLAYYWYILSVDVRKNDMAVKRADLFRKLFMLRYAETYGRGITVRKSGSAVPLTVELCYSPECDGLRKYLPVRRCRKAPISGQNISIDKLKSVALRCSGELELYADRRKKYYGGESVLALPPALWKEEEAAGLQGLKERIKDKMYLMRMDELKETFFKTEPFSKNSLLALAYSLETENIAMEPDIISFPDLAGDKFIFHVLKNKIPKTRTSSSYRFCRLIMELAVSAYMLCNPRETTFKLYFPIKLDDYFYERLKGYIPLLMRCPPSLRQCIKHLNVADKDDKEHIIKYIRESVLEDRNTSYEAVSVIEKLYKGFGFSEEKLYSDLHTGGVSALAAKNADVSLDHDKIKQLKEDSDHVYSMLSDIFKDGDSAENASSKTDSKQETAGYFNFDEAETNFLKTILSRAEWPRDELTEKARQQGILLDGFMEIVNETAYNEFDEALIEGDETITINTDIAGMMTEKL